MKMKEKYYPRIYGTMMEAHLRDYRQMVFVSGPRQVGEVEISVSGAGEFTAAGNGNPHDRRGFESKRQKLFFGRAMVAVRRTGPGEINVKAAACQ